jgi:hypothetical protein
MTGAVPTPRCTLMAATPFVPLAAPPPQFAYVPAKLSYWGNNQYGDCVSAEEAWAKATNVPEIFIPDDTVISWARKGGYLDGADLTSVMDSMKSSGFQIGSQLYNDGGHATVDWSNEATLQAAIYEGPVKLAMSSSALPSGAGNQQGWYALQKGRSGQSDHCTGLGGFGPADYLYKQLGVAMPSGVSFPPMCYLFFTWSTLGIVSHDWIMGCVDEAHVRNPTTVGVPPLPAPTPVGPIDWIP